MDNMKYIVFACNNYAYLYNRLFNHEMLNYYKDAIYFQRNSIWGKRQTARRFKTALMAKVIMRIYGIENYRLEIVFDRDDNKI